MLNLLVLCSIGYILKCLTVLSLEKRKGKCGSKKETNGGIKKVKTGDKKRLVGSKKYFEYINSFL